LRRFGFRWLTSATEQRARKREQRLTDLAWEYAWELARAEQSLGPDDEAMESGAQGKTTPNRLHQLARATQVWLPILVGSYMASYGFLRTLREGSDLFMAAFCLALFGLTFWALATWFLDALHFVAAKIRSDGSRLADGA
jgi:hypothetical protein